MLQCSSCNFIFETPDSYIEVHGEPQGQCPGCGQSIEDFYDVYACKKCGGYSPDDGGAAAMHGYCPACAKALLDGLQAHLDALMVDEVAFLNEATANGFTGGKDLYDAGQRKAG